MLLAIASGVIAYLVYEAVMVGLWGATLGKRIVGVEVVSSRDGGRPGFKRSMLRTMVPAVLLVGLPVLYPLPYVLAAAAKDQRGPHDRLAGTRVVVRSR